MDEYIREVQARAIKSKALGKSLSNIGASKLLTTRDNGFGLLVVKSNGKNKSTLFYKKGDGYLDCLSINRFANINEATMYVMNNDLDSFAIHCTFCDWWHVNDELTKNKFLEVPHELIKKEA